jgi:hypothetical protein
VRRLRIRTEALLVLASVAAAAFLFASELMDTFHLTPPGGEALEASSGLDRHHGAMIVLAVFAVVALLVAITAGSKPAAYAVAACGAIALLIFLIGDLPKANSVGSLGSQQEFLFDAKAVPQTGFWLEMIGSLLLAVCGMALATLPSFRLKLVDVGRGSREEGGRFIDWSKQL